MQQSFVKWGIICRAVLYYLFLAAFFVLPMGTSPFTIIGILIIAVWVLSGEWAFRSCAFYFKFRWLLPVSGIVFITWFGLLWSEDAFGLGIDYAEKTYYWLFALILANVIVFDISNDKMIKSFLAGLGINVVIAWLQYARIIPSFSRWGATGYTGLSSGYNTLSIMLLIGVLMASYYFRRSQPKSVYGFLVLAYFSHVLLLEGRMAYLLLVVISPAVVFNLFNGRRIHYMILAYCCGIFLMLSSPVIRERISFTDRYVREFLRETYTSGGELLTGKKYFEQFDRIYMWRWALILFANNPVLGVGTGGYKEAVLSAGGDKVIAHPHSNFLYVAVSFGIVGILLYAWLFWHLLRTGWRNRGTPGGFFVVASSIVILLGGLTDTHILDSGGAFLLSVTTGLQAALCPGFTSEVPEIHSDGGLSTLSAPRSL